MSWLLVLAVPNLIQMHCRILVLPLTILHSVPKYFRQTKYKSFQRQLNLWGFERLTKGPEKGKIEMHRNKSIV
jgi:hypothetical protein